MTYYVIDKKSGRLYHYGSDIGRAMHVVNFVESNGGETELYFDTHRVEYSL